MSTIVRVNNDKHSDVRVYSTEEIIAYCVETFGANHPITLATIAKHMKPSPCSKKVTSESGSSQPPMPVRAGFGNSVVTQFDPEIDQPICDEFLRFVEPEEGGYPLKQDFRPIDEIAA